jgi:hypothetical protein
LYCKTYMQLTALFILIGTIACESPTQSQGVLGQNGRAYFSGQNDLIFTEHLMVGSYLRIGVQPVSNDDASSVMMSTFKSADSRVIEVTISDSGAGEFDVIGPGNTALELVSESGEVIDFVILKAAYANKIEVTENVLLGTEISPILPREIAIILDEPVSLSFQGRDSCGQPLLPVEAIETSVTNPEIIQLTEDGSGLLVEGLAPGAQEIHFQGRKGPETTLDLETVSKSDVSRIDITMASADPPQAELWGRAYSGPREVIGISYEWSSEDSVELSNQNGITVIATVAEAPDESAENGVTTGEAAVEDSAENTSTALVRANWGTLNTDFDMKQATYADIQAYRIAPAEESSPLGCGDSTNDGCDPYAACMLIFGTGLRRMTRRRRFSSRMPPN